MDLAIMDPSLSALQKYRDERVELNSCFLLQLTVKLGNLVQATLVYMVVVKILLMVSYSSAHVIQDMKGSSVIG